MATRISFDLEIYDEDRVGTAQTTIRVTEDVPAGTDPRQYLRDRVLKEFGVTVQQPPQAANANASAADVNTGNVQPANQ